VPDYPDNADEDERRDLRANLDIRRRNYAVVQGFIRGFGENIRDACEEKLYQDLEHIRFGYDKLWPIQYMAEIKRHCPLDVQAIKDAKEHLFRGWEGWTVITLKLSSVSGSDTSRSRTDCNAMASPSRTKISSNTTCLRFANPEHLPTRSFGPSNSWSQTIRIGIKQQIVLKAPWKTWRK
jgi:hypothetical protein